MGVNEDHRAPSSTDIHDQDNKDKKNWRLSHEDKFYENTIEESILYIKLMTKSAKLTRTVAALTTGLNV